MINKNTKEFINNIKSNDINSITFVRNEEAISYLNSIIEEKNISKAGLLKLIDHDLNNGYKYLDGSRSMNRDFLLKVIITLNLDIEVANRLLKLFSHSELYVKKKRDYIIINSLKNNLTLAEINNILNQHNDCDLLI